MYSAARGGIHPTTMRSQESDQVGALPLKGGMTSTPDISHGSHNSRGRFPKRERKLGPVHIPYRKRVRMGSSFRERRWEEDNDPNRDPSVEKIAAKLADGLFIKPLYAKNA